MMKKAEIVQILDKHLKSLVSGKKDEYFEFEAMKLMPEYKACLNAMLELEQTVVNENCNLPIVSNNEEIKTLLTYCPKCKSTDIKQYTKGTDKCNNCNHAWDIYRPFKGVE